MRAKLLMMLLLLSMASAELTGEDVYRIVHDENMALNSSMTKYIDNRMDSLESGVYGTMNSRLQSIFTLVDSTNKRVSVLKDKEPVTKEEMDIAILNGTRLAVGNVATKDEVSEMSATVLAEVQRLEHDNQRLRAEVFFLVIFIALFVPVVNWKLIKREARIAMLSVEKYKHPVRKVKK